MYECEGDLHDQLTTATYAKLAMKSRPATTPNTKHQQQQPKIAQFKKTSFKLILNRK